MARHDRWRERDFDRYRGERDWRRKGSGYRSERDDGRYGRGGSDYNDEFERGGREPGYGGQGRPYRGGGGGGYGGRDFERGSYRGGGGYGTARGGSDWENRGGWRGGGGYGRSDRGGDWDRSYGGSAGMRGGQSWGDRYTEASDYGADWNPWDGRERGGMAYGGSYGVGGGYGSGAGGNYRSGSGGEYRARGETWGRHDYGRSGGGEERGWWDRAADEVSSWFGDEDAARRRRMDEHRGRGPKGYTRSDDRIREDVSDRLTDDWMVDASDIEIQVSSSEVTLTGTVESREAKRRAEDIAESVSGVRHVQNNLRVKDRASGSWMGETGSSSGGAAGTGGAASGRRSGG
jgi:osmotically-inducible protein OsmY